MEITKYKSNNMERASLVAFSILFMFAFLLVMPNPTSAQKKKPCCQKKTTKKKQMNDSFSNCLPKEIKSTDIVSYSLDPKVKHTTVKDELTKLKAKCVNNKLVDNDGKEIRFFKPSCWGNPPADYQEILERERKELEELKEKFTVIVFKCNPMIP